MKKVLFVAFTILLVAACSSKGDYEVGQKTTMEVNTNLNVGEVFLGENVKATILIKNTGSYPLILGEVKGSCSCTVSEYPKDPVAPGKTAEIKTEIETRAFGKLTKDVRITANTSPSVTTVYISADVINK